MVNLCKFFFVLSIVFFLVAGYLIWQRNNPLRLSFSEIPKYSNSGKSPINNYPVLFIIKELKIRLPIIPATITKNKWETTTKGVSWLSTSAKPGDIGNSVFYGHNWSNILGNLNFAKPGQEILIVFVDKTIKKFIIGSIALVNFNQTSVLNESKDTRITLYTCTGIFDEKRLIITAFLAK